MRCNAYTKSQARNENDSYQWFSGEYRRMGSLLAERDVYIWGRTAITLHVFRARRLILSREFIR